MKTEKMLIKNEKGQVMLMAVIMLLVGGLCVSSLLSYMGTGLLTNRVYESRTGELYAADAGIEDAMWKLQHKDEAGYLPCNPSSEPRTYTISDVNGKTVDVKIEYVEMDGSIYYKITSAGKSGGDSTLVESYVQFVPGDELNIFSGALSAKGDISLGKDSEVNGDVYHCGDFDPTGVGGDWTDKGCAPFPSQDENVAFAQAFKNEALKGKTYNGTLNIQSNTTLGSGSPTHYSYITGGLTISKDVTITLDGVVYVKGSISCAKTLTITGTGSIVAEGSIYFSKLANYTVTGDSIIMSLNGDVTIKKADPYHERTINALIYAPNGAATFDKDMTVFGGVVAESIQADKEGSFTFVPKTDWDFPGELPGALEMKTYTVSQ